MARLGHWQCQCQRRLMSRRAEWPGSRSRNSRGASVTPPFEHFGGGPKCSNGGLTLASVLGFVSENHAASRTCQRLRVRVGSLERVMCQSAP